MELKLKDIGKVEKSKALSMGFEKFCLVQEGYAETWNLKKPTKKELEKFWIETTGEKIKTNTE